MYHKYINLSPIYVYFVSNFNYCNVLINKLINISFHDKFLEVELVWLWS